MTDKRADRVLADLEEIGYDAWSLVVGAWAVGAPHRRNRVWIVANARHRNERSEGCAEPDGGAVAGGDARVAHRSGDTLREQSGRCGGPSRASEDVVGESGADELADADRGRREVERGGWLLDRKRSPCWYDADRRDGADMVHTEQSRLEGHWTDAGQPPQPEPRNASPRWPARPSEVQHEWEERRLVEFQVGGATDGLPVGLVRARRRNNREALKALGNSVVPDVVAAVLAAMMELPIRAKSRPASRRGDSKSDAMRKTRRAKLNNRELFAPDDPAEKG